jgi:hypothetical protein
VHLIKTYGTELAEFRFFRLPKVIEQARAAISDQGVVGYLLCALESVGAD